MMLGRGIRFQSKHTPRAAAVLLYLPESAAGQALTDPKLESALRERFVIAYGCRNGACGTCKGRVLEGEVDYGIYQEH